MTDRSERIGRIVRLRDNELKKTVQQLQEATTRYTAMLDALNAATSARDQAIEHRRNLAQGHVDVVTYLQAEQWLLSLQAKHSIAAQQVQQASVMLRKCTMLTHRARTKVKQLEQLQETLLKRAARERELAERRLDDEIAQRAFRRKH